MAARASDYALLPRNVTCGQIWQDVEPADLFACLEYGLTWVQPAALELALADRRPQLRLVSLWDVAEAMIDAFPPPTTHAHFGRAHARDPPAAGLLSPAVCAALARRVEAFVRDEDLRRVLTAIRAGAPGGVVCALCGEAYAGEDVVACAGGDQFCRPCFATFLQRTVLEHARLSDLGGVPCILTDCQLLFPKADVERNVSSYSMRVVREKQEARVRADVLASVTHGGEHVALDCVQCGTVARTTPVEVRPGRLGIQCTGCPMVHCPRMCGLGPHRGRCARPDVPGWLVQLLGKDPNSGFCPRCQMGVSRVAGCTHVRCLCGCSFCIVCKLPYEIGSAHEHRGCRDTPPPPPPPPGTAPAPRPPGNLRAEADGADAVEL